MGENFVQWPDYFPADCPSQDARPATGEVYRLVKKNPPESEDFIPLREKKPTAGFGEKECQACGLSVLRDVEDALQMRKRARGMAKRLVAKGRLSPCFGKIKHTPSSRDGSSHHRWWVPTEVQPWRVFRVVQIPQEG